MPRAAILTTREGQNYALRVGQNYALSSKPGQTLERPSLYVYILVGQVRHERGHVDPVRAAKALSNVGRLHA